MVGISGTGGGASGAAAPSSRDKPATLGEKRFEALDRDGDRALSVGEMIQMLPPLPPGTGGRGVDFQAVAFSQIFETELAAAPYKDDPAGRFLEAMRVMNKSFG